MYLLALYHTGYHSHVQTLAAFMFVSGITVLIASTRLILLVKSHCNPILSPICINLPFISQFYGKMSSGCCRVWPWPAIYHVLSYHIISYPTNPPLSYPQNPIKTSFKRSLYIKPDSNDTIAKQICIMMKRSACISHKTQHVALGPCQKKVATRDLKKTQMARETCWTKREFLW